MQVGEILDVIEQAAPLSIQEGYDNSGLIVGDRNAHVNSALLCVDVSESVLDEAIAKGTGLIISHHPIIFHGLKRLTGATYVERVVARAIQHGIAIYACHTNLDQIPQGLSQRLAYIIGVGNTTVLTKTGTSHIESTDSVVGFGVVGDLERPVLPEVFLKHIKSVLPVEVIRHSDICRAMISRVAICTGSGASLMAAARDSGADIYISADFKYNDFIDADNNIIIADIGHFESEYCAIEVLYDIITKKITTFALHKSENSVNPINYFV